MSRDGVSFVVCARTEPEASIRPEPLREYGQVHPAAVLQIQDRLGFHQHTIRVEVPIDVQHHHVAVGNRPEALDHLAALRVLNLRSQLRALLVPQTEASPALPDLLRLLDDLDALQRLRDVAGRVAPQGDEGDPRRLVLRRLVHRAERRDPDDPVVSEQALDRADLPAISDEGLRPQRAQPWHPVVLVDAQNLHDEISCVLLAVPAGLRDQAEANQAVAHGAQHIGRGAPAKLGSKLLADPLQDGDDHQLRGHSLVLQIVRVYDESRQSWSIQQHLKCRSHVASVPTILKAASRHMLILVHVEFVVHHLPELLLHRREYLGTPPHRQDVYPSSSRVALICL
mmetsp:Transcript_19544/g.56890  ORF Transcript_19544/g.56890 Transcript_19544/m.56890 type:complete len:341 (+) Transcript_19544:767-1789(+)